MPSIDSPRDPGDVWPSRDRLEAYVRYCLVNNPGIFRNHFSESLPRMAATIPGQYNTQCGIDVLAIDSHRPRRRLWLIEISRGRRIGAGSIKELPARVYAGNKAQMSQAWRRAAADRFLETPTSTEMLQTLFDVSGLNRERLRELFEGYFEPKGDDSDGDDDIPKEPHKAAVVVPAGCHVAGSETGLQFADDVYTFHWLFARRRTDW